MSPSLLTAGLALLLSARSAAVTAPLVPRAHVMRTQLLEASEYAQLCAEKHLGLRLLVKWHDELSIRIDPATVGPALSPSPRPFVCSNRGLSTRQGHSHSLSPDLRARDHAAAI
eukprot:SAG31_NODE_27503_length_425_cov_0.776074_1_plen_113_part_01